MELRHLRYFVAVAEESSFTRAARRLGIAQPPLSQQIRSLEDELGVQLFRRVPHGVELSDAGAALLPEARATLTQAERSRRLAKAAGTGETGRLRVGFTGSAAFHRIVPAALRGFRRTYPGVELALEEHPTTQLLDRLIAEQLDAAFVRIGRRAPDDVDLHPLADEPMCVALPTSHRLARSRAVRLAVLADEPFILFPRSAGASLFDEITDACGRAGFVPHAPPAQAAPQLTSIANFVAAELGISIVPRSIAQIRVPGVRYLPITPAKDAPIARLAIALRRGERVPTTSNFLVIVLAERHRSSGT